jgi:hypothetical protein
VEALLALRLRHPSWGAKKLLHTLSLREPTLALPGRSTVCDTQSSSRAMPEAPAIEYHQPYHLSALTPVLPIRATAHFSCLGRLLAKVTFAKPGEGDALLRGHTKVLGLFNLFSRLTIPTAVTATL